MWVLGIKSRSSGRAARAEPSLQPQEYHFCFKSFYHVVCVCVCVRERERGGGACMGPERPISRSHFSPFYCVDLRD
jgi:hypothetical protein